VRTEIDGQNLREPGEETKNDENCRAGKPVPSFVETAACVKMKELA